ncbi:MAG: isoprenylcysteine carboxylmethyltransferase family protein [Blastocatellia bacterium]|nr:isoprenylcysteine carboxylmethyltransferase family protein [Blastocatellia bacterium]
MASSIENPGVWFPPPILFVLGFFIGLALNHLWPLPLVPEPRPNALLWLSWGVIVVGLSIIVSGLLTFRFKRTAIYPNQPATKLVQSGPYRFTRNPMYVGLTATYLGIAVLTNLLWTLMFLPIVLIVLQRAVIRREERYLTNAFGNAYQEYCQRVRRWL